MVEDIGQIIGNHVGQNVVQNLGIQNIKNKNGLSVLPRIANQNGNGKVVTARAEGNSNGNNENQIRLLKRKKKESNSILSNLISWLLQVPRMRLRK
ncbi:hypothetical protein Tco_1054189 [Tanacetum coccineum]|uniref:Uncharacterized protein n=1 Tax=Tanacetum coccineum TaxID=301880 RepID=A0ABQ5GW19_9ASTR